jgi:GNAT superfamily N-acetyltransferase
MLKVTSISSMRPLPLLGILLVVFARQSLGFSLGTSQVVSSHSKLADGTTGCNSMTRLHAWNRNHDNDNRSKTTSSTNTNRDNGKDLEPKMDRTPLTHADVEWKIRPDRGNEPTPTRFNTPTTAAKSTPTASTTTSTVTTTTAQSSGDKGNPWMLSLIEFFKSHPVEKAPKTSSASTQESSSSTPLRASRPPSPLGNKALLEVYLKDHSPQAKWGAKKQTRIGRFGISLEPGPVIPALEDTIVQLYGASQAYSAPMTAAALIYMYVEPEHRQRNLGTLALEVIRSIHASLGCQYTILVADDQGSGSLIDWYRIARSHGQSQQCVWYHYDCQDGEHCLARRLYPSMVQRLIKLTFIYRLHEIIDTTRFY